MCTSMSMNFSRNNPNFDIHKNIHSKLVTFG